MTINISCIYKEDYKHYSILFLQVTNDYIVNSNLTYKIHVIKLVFYLEPAAPPEGNYFKNVTQRRIFFSFISKNNC